MKKILFATTALIATAGMAAAEVSFGGYGRFGTLYIDGAAPETRIESRFRLNIDASTESDGGLTFGARVRMQADDAGAAASVAGLNGVRFYAMSGGLTVAVGNVLGAIDSMPNLYTGSVGLSGLAYANVVTNFLADDYDSTGAGRNGVEVIYDGGNFGAHLSSTNLAGLKRTAASVSFSFQDYEIAVGYQDSNAAADTNWVLTAAGTFGPAKVVLAYADNGNSLGNLTLAADVKVGAATAVQAYYNNDEASAKKDSFGLGFRHNLGGGASIRGGVADTNGTTRADLGVLFNF